ncbi:MAG: Uma2 family endonuclease [Bacteroidota bacterium]|nr:Uma2 family endonuclease [Bacteroidota bacterium]
MPQIVEELKITYRDILSLGESNQRTEIFDGELIMGPMPTTYHQLVQMNIGSMIRDYVNKRGIGKVFASVDVNISEVIVLQPDICFLSNERFSINDGKKFNAVPDLVVEILSESTEERYRTFKFREYAKHGAMEYWLVSPEKKEVEIYQNSLKGFQLVKIFTANEIMNTPLFQDAAFSVKEIFL